MVNADPIQLIMFDMHDHVNREHRMYYEKKLFVGIAYKEIIHQVIQKQKEN